MMNQKEYSELHKHLSLENEVKEKEKVLDAFHRVKKGESFSLNDLQIVGRTIAENSHLKYPDREHSMHDTIFFLERDINSSKENVGKSKKRLKKRGIDLDRLRRQRRIYQEKQRQTEKGIES